MYLKVIFFFQTNEMWKIEGDLFLLKLTFHNSIGYPVDNWAAANIVDVTRSITFVHYECIKVLQLAG